MKTLLMNLGKHPIRPVKLHVKTALEAPRRKTVERVTKRKIRCHASVLMRVMAKWKATTMVSTPREATRRGIVLNLKKTQKCIFLCQGLPVPQCSIDEGQNDCRGQAGDNLNLKLLRNSF